MDLKFTGTGSAFNTKLGNTSAYLKSPNKKSMLLIDCGNSTFEKIVEKGILNDVDGIYVIITHLHSDHAGSLGTLIHHCFYELKKKITLLYPETNIVNILQSIGVQADLYNFFRLTPYVVSTLTDINFSDGISITPIYANHTKDIACYGYLLEDTNSNLFYSGDANDLSSGVLKSLEEKELNQLYLDTCGLDYEGNVHLSLDKLTEAIKPEYRNKVYCMHLDRSFDAEKAKSLGFNVVEAE